MNNIILILSQVLGFIAFIISLLAFHKNRKEKILGNMILSNLFDLIHYLLLGAYSGCITKLLAMCRNVFVIFKDKNKALSSNIFLYIFILTYTISGILTFENVWSILPIISAIIYAVAIWKGNELTLKKAACFGYFLWLIYNILVLSISGILSNIVSICSLFIAIKNNSKKQTA